MTIRSYVLNRSQNQNQAVQNIKTDNTSLFGYVHVPAQVLYFAFAFAFHMTGRRA
jgi:hypothetical protein